MMIVFDTETTNLMRPSAAALADQPHIIEIGAILLNNDTLEEVDRFDTLIKPPFPIDEEEHKKITRLSNSDLAEAPVFIEMYGALCDFFIGERTIVAHNLPFDLGVLTTELKRMNAEFAFPYPPEQRCTVQLTEGWQGKRLKLIELYELATGNKLDQKHRAINDVEALCEVVRWLRSEHGII